MISVNWAAPASTGTLHATLLMKPNSGTSDTLQATAAITIYTPPTYTVSVTPDGSDVTVSQPIDTTYQFKVSDIGNTNATYALSVSCPGLTCSVPSTVSVTHGSYSMVTVSFNSGSPGATGTVTLSASATGTSDNGSINVVPLTHSVSVTPSGSPINVRAAADTTAPFTVTLTGTASSVTYDLIITCTEPVYGCTGPSTVAVTNGMPQAVTVSYKTRSDLHGGAGSLSLKATSTYGTTYQSTGSYNITVPNTTDLYTVSAASRTTAIARDRCLTVSAGVGAAYECGDLRLVHALPSVRTMAKERTPVLLYSSQTAHVAPYVGANVLLQSFATTPTALTGTLSINGASPCSQSWTTSGWTAGTTRRVVATCGDVSLATGVYPYSLAMQATFTGGGTMNDTLSGSLIIVNRSASPFGSGWWVAGVEQIYFPSDGTTRLWVGGDGSARVYRQRGSSNAFYADSVDRPDSLTYDSGTSSYTRWAPHGLQVRFNSSGQHTSTVNRLGQTTSFAYSSGLLQTITVPPSSAGLTYTFTYTSDKLTGVSAPAVSGSRSVVVTQSSGQITKITDPDASSVQFGYSGSDTRVTSRTDRLGHATTYGYGTGGTLDSVSVAMASPTPAIVTTFDAGEVKGMTGGSVADTSAFYTTINGPRRDTTVTKIWLDGYGAARKIADALGDTTKITRGDARWPALVTRVVDASGFVTSATYGGRGNIASDTSISPLGGSFGNAVTSYTYDGTYDFVTRIVGPTGEVWRSSIDGSTGNRTSEALTDTGSVHSTSYRYDSSCGMVRSTIGPSTAPDSVTYDARCNPSAVKSPKGFWTTYRSDAIGRVVADSSPTGVKDSVVYDVMDRVTRSMKTGPARNGVLSQTATVVSAYDSAGRLTSVARSSTSDAAGVGTLTTSYRYDWANRRVASVATDGNVDSTIYDPAGNAISAITRLGGTSRPVVLKYDAMNRMVKRSVPSYTYASETIGLATKVSTERWAHKYPLLTNMPTGGDSGYTVPAQVDTMKYDAVGRLIMANNGDAHVSRTYYPGGSLKSDTSRVRTLADTTSGSGGDFTHHVYGLNYGYDVAGRITTLSVPHQLAPRIQPDSLSTVLMVSGVTQSIRDTISYTYDAGVDGTGWLTEVDGLLPSDVFTYFYAPRGEIASIRSLVTVPDGPTALPITESRTYDDDGWLKTLQVIRRDHPDTLRDATLTLDAEGRVVTLDDTARYALSVTPTTANYLYSGLGQLLSSDYETTSPDGYTNLSATETTSYDALGNWVARANTASSVFAAPGGGSFSGTQATRAGRYISNVGRLKGETLDATRSDTLVYDSAGNLHAMLGRNGGKPQQYQDRVSYYSVDGHLVAADARSVADGGTALRGHTAFEEYRYDALGRRIWTRARRWCDDVTGATGGADAVACEISSVTRTVWDGSAELAEVEMPATDSTASSTIENDTLAIVRPVPGTGDALYDANRLYGQVIYVNGLETDRPLAITRNHYADASKTSGSGSVSYAVYVPFSIIPLWNSQGRADQSVIGGTAAPGQDYLCVDTGKTRCAEVSLDWGVFPYARSGAATGSWQGTLLLDKPDAAGTYYRRNRSYDPSTARFTQEDPIGLAGGINEYGFASGDPANYGDPFGLAPLDNLFYNMQGEEIAREKNDKPDRYFLRRDGKSDIEMDGPAGGPISGVVADRAALNQVAVELANAAPQMHHIFGDFKTQSFEGGALDFKHQLHGNILWNGGNGMYVHNDKVGNAAWAYYANKRMGVPLFMALSGAQYQAIRQTHSLDDPLDQAFIRRGYGIP